MSSPENRWNHSHELVPGHDFTITAGEKSCRIQQQNSDVLWRLDKLGEPTPDLSWQTAEAPPPQPDQEWQRWAGVTNSQTLRWRPALPNRPIVVRPRFPLTIGGGASVDVYIGIPLFLQLAVDDFATGLFSDSCVMDLSNTWWGTHRSGMLAYSLKTRARRAIEDSITQRDYVCHCKATFVNKSDRPIPVQRFLIQCPELRLYWNQHHWTNDITVGLINDKDPAEIHHAEGKPSSLSSATLLAEPRNPGKSLFKTWAIFS